MNELIKQISPQQMVRRATVLPKTGQVISYRTGDDGDVKAGKARRFQKVGNLVYDWSTMLCWVANPAAIIPGDPGGIAATAAGVWAAEGAVGGGYEYGQIVQSDGSPDSKFYVCILDHTEAHEPPDAEYWVETPWTASAANLTTPATMTWNDAIDRCLALNYGGVGGWSANNPCGWRLANGIEAISVYDLGVVSTPKIASVFSFAAAEYWTSSQPGPTTASQTVTFQYNQMVTTTRSQSLTYHPLPVRSLII